MKFLFRCLLAFSCLALPGLSRAEGPEAVSIRVVRPYTYVVEGRFLTPAPRQIVWAVLKDYESIPRYSPSLKSSVITARQGSIVMLTQEGTAGFLFFKRHFVMKMKVRESFPDRIDFEELSHRDFEKYQGHWQVTETVAGTEVAYGLEAVADFGPLVNWAAKDYIRSTSTDSLRRLKAAIHAQPRPSAAKPDPPAQTVHAAARPKTRPKPARPVPVPTALPSPIRLVLGKGSWLELEGTSTLHGFVCRTGTLSLASETRATGDAGPGKLISENKVRSFLLELPVESLKSGEGGLDKNLYKAMETAKFPGISFRMDSYRASDGMLQAAGILTIHGTPRQVSLSAEVRGLSGTAHLLGSTRLSMKDYGVTPPRLFLGTLTVGDQVTVRYDLELSAAE